MTRKNKLLRRASELQVRLWIFAWLASCPGCRCFHWKSRGKGQYLLTDWLLLQNFPWQHLVAGAAGGAISRTATAPLELLRLQAMTSSGKVHIQGDLSVHQRRPHLIQALKAATGGQGWQGLWRGNGLNVLRAGPQKALDFFSFEVYKVMSQPDAKRRLCILAVCPCYT